MIEDKRKLGIRIVPKPIKVREKVKVANNSIKLDSMPSGDVGLIFIFADSTSSQIVDIVNKVEIKENKVFFEDESLNNKYALVEYITI